MNFFGGARAPLITPAGCGSYTTTSELTPWNGGPTIPSSSGFVIDSGCGQTFSPSFTAGTGNNQAAAYSPFAMSFSRQDGEQRLGGLEETLPPGLLGKLAGIPLCGNAEADAGACPEGSQIGTVAVGAGPGPTPLFVKGKIYLTGPYNNGPFGVAVEVPAIAGPFNLDENGKPVTVRGSIHVNPSTAQATVVSDPFPTILQGVPLDVRRVDVTLNRPGFTFNPTNCSPTQVTATLDSTTGASAGVSSPFQAANCASLPFKPSFAVSTQGKTSKADGASLTAKLTYPAPPVGSGQVEL